MMREKFYSRLVTVSVILASMVIFTAGFAMGQANTGETESVTAAVTTEKAVGGGEVKSDKNNLQLADAPLYVEIPRSLDPVECGQCHPGEYKLLRESISKHRFACTDCHEQLHAYVPTRNNYIDIMPQCDNCHELPHGKVFASCQECHNDPHTPLDIPFAGVSRKIKSNKGRDVEACEICHYDSEGKEFEMYPSKHNQEVGCSGCHEEKHGHRPTCFNCHEPHVQGQVYADCKVCHRPHSAKEILPYPEATDNKLCGSCHTELFSTLQTNPTKHTGLQCATCHVLHGKIPACQDCHDKPHGAKVLKKFGSCLECHIDPHDMPIDPAK